MKVSCDREDRSKGMEDVCWVVSSMSSPNTSWPAVRKGRFVAWVVCFVSVTGQPGCDVCGAQCTMPFSINEYIS